MKLNADGTLNITGGGFYIETNPHANNTGMFFGSGPRTAADDEPMTPGQITALIVIFFITVGLTVLPFLFLN